MEKLIKPSDLREQAKALIAAGKMPDLDTLLQTIADTRAKYLPLIAAARRAR